jgi:hypothetical protein
LGATHDDFLMSSYSFMPEKSAITLGGYSSHKNLSSLRAPLQLMYGGARGLYDEKFKGSFS